MILDRLLRSMVVLSAMLLAGCGTFRSDPAPPSVWRADIPVGGFIQPPASMTAQQAISEITSRSVLLLGTPYRLGGSSPAEGFDCSGLIAHVVQDAFRLRFPRTTEEQSLVGKPVSRHAIEPGDLVFFNTLGRPNSHVGVYLGDRRFLHAPNRRGVVRIESLDQSYWSARFDQARRVIARN
jgi:cell wall-associated NlpC family hydrolase